MILSCWQWLIMLLLGYLLNPLLSIWLSSHTLSNALKWSDLESSNLLFTTQPFPVGSHTLATSQRLPRLCSTTQLPFSWQARWILALWAVGDPKDSLPRAWYELLGQQGTAPQGGMWIEMHCAFCRILCSFWLTMVKEHALSLLCLTVEFYWRDLKQV